MCRQEDWFDSGSEGPFPTEEVVRRITEAGGNHAGFHLASQPGNRFETVHPDLYAEIVSESRKGGE